MQNGSHSPCQPRASLPDFLELISPGFGFGTGPRVGVGNGLQGQAISGGGTHV